MIDFQSPAFAKRPNHRSCYSLSLGQEGRDEGKLYLRRQSALIKVGRVSLPRSTASLAAIVRAYRESMPSTSSTLLWPFNVPQGHSSSFSPIQGFLEKRLFIFCSTTRFITAYSDLFNPLPNGLERGLSGQQPRKYPRFQSLPSCSKVFQTVPSLFSEKKDCLFCYPGLVPVQSSISPVP